MTIDETKTLVDKIKIYRPTFGGHFDKTGMDKLKLEWYRILEPYDYEDVNKKLDEYFENGDNFGRYPDVYYLIKYLKKSNEKLKSGIRYVQCQNCNRTVEFDKYNEHFDRCSSVEYISKMSLKYYDKTLNKKKLFELINEEFEDKYWKFCEALVDKMEDGQDKYNLKNVILIHNGGKPKLDINSMLNFEENKKW